MAAPKGNKFGSKAKECEQALRRALARKYDSTDFRKGLDAISSKIVDLAANDGDKWAIDTIFDRIDGRPGQSLEVHADTTIRRAEELTDGHLADIATGRSEGTPEAAGGEEESTSVH